MFRFLKELYYGSQLFMFLNCFVGASSQSRKNKDEEHNEKRTKNHTDSNKGVLLSFLLLCVLVALDGPVP